MSSRRPPVALGRALAGGMLAAGVLAAGGCAASAGAASTASGVAPAPAPALASAVPASGAAAAVPASLRFTGRTLDGAPFDAATMAGRPTLLWFWAPWCATCASQASSITDLKEQYGDRLAILGIAGLGDNKAMHDFVSDLDVDTVPNLDDQAGELWRRFHVTEQSVFVLIDRGGTIRHTGWLDDVDLSAQLTALVG